MARTRNLLGAYSLAIADRVRDASEEVAASRGAGPAGIVQIGLYPGQSMESLRHALGLTQSATTRMIERLEQVGLVINEKSDATDARKAVLSLSARGTKIMNEILAARESVIKSHLDLLSEQEQVQFGALLEKLMTNMVDTKADSDYVCRLCDMRNCPDDVCPVHFKRQPVN
ncbi:hypothetical protein R69746_08811 [Paraburkholderia aspalathi]|nr:hypothetical protein R69746_08811 [Paraburkholderia aspalathi]